MLHFIGLECMSKHFYYERHVAFSVLVEYYTETHGENNVFSSLLCSSLKLIRNTKQRRVGILFVKRPLKAIIQHQFGPIHETILQSRNSTIRLKLCRLCLYGVSVAQQQQSTNQGHLKNRLHEICIFGKGNIWVKLS